MQLRVSAIEGHFLVNITRSVFRNYQNKILFFFVLLIVHLHILWNENNQMHYLLLIYFVNQPLHVSGMFIAHHQEVYTVYAEQLVRVIRLS
jgi:hypothetical protein